MKKKKPLQEKANSTTEIGTTDLLEIEVIGEIVEPESNKKPNSFLGKIDLSPFSDPKAIKILSDYINKRTLGEEKLESIIRKCIN